MYFYNYKPMRCKLKFCVKMSLLLSPSLYLLVTLSSPLLSSSFQLPLLPYQLCGDFLFRSPLKAYTHPPPHFSILTDFLSFLFFSLPHSLTCWKNKKKRQNRRGQKGIKENKRKVLAEEGGTKLEPHFSTTKEAIFDAISCAMKCACRIPKRHGVTENDYRLAGGTGILFNFFNHFFL